MTKFLSILWRFIKSHKGIIIALLIISYVLAACLPYIQQGKASKSTINSFSIADYYSDDTSCDRACILFSNEDALTERLRLINNAKDEIILSSFDFHADKSGKLVLASLIDAANRGVKVNVLIDGVSYFTNSKNRAYFTALGSMDNATIKIYNPLNALKPHKGMARMHDKYLIADNSCYILGGRNTYDYFLGEGNGYKNYDWDVLVYNSTDSNNSSIYQIREYYESVWNLKDCKIKCNSTDVFNKSKVEKARKELDTLYSNSINNNEDWYNAIDYNSITYKTNNIKLLSNPINSSVKEPVLFYNMTELMLEADGDIDFHTPYIIANNYMTSRLKMICDSDKDVTMMTNSVANNGNPFGAADYKAHKNNLLKTGVHIIEYDSGVSYHGKCFTIGDRLTGVGSFNWDMRSAYLDTELMLVIDSNELNTSMQTYMATYEADALSVNSDGSYELRDNQTPSILSGKRKQRINLISPFIDLLRYLM